MVGVHKKTVLKILKTALHYICKTRIRDEGGVCTGEDEENSYTEIWQSSESQRPILNKVYAYTGHIAGPWMYSVLGLTISLNGREWKISYRKGWINSLLREFLNHWIAIEYQYIGVLPTCMHSMTFKSGNLEGKYSSL